ncbi:polyketide synthase [Lecanosticta acicola]|uniref:Polyketide synthase n=1 Tax=Lecanosticta acicola TaxID=111012 RepID=A0AAI9E8I8_9PEZI|nr:polyketide synthase [Lecanosticta acicola]
MSPPSATATHVPTSNGTSPEKGERHINGHVESNGAQPVNGTAMNGAHTNGNVTNGSSSPNVGATIPIAVVGMANRLPGGLNTPQQFWEFLISKGDARCRVPASRYNIDAYYSKSGKPGTVNTQYGYFLDESVDIGAFDASLFSLRKGEIDRADPHQRHMLEVVREALEDAGETKWRGRNIGCYIGTFGEDWFEMFAKESQQYGTYRATGHGDFMVPNRISHDLDIHGPSMIIKTACSSALVGLHEACQAIGRGDCESAIVGGANLIMAPYMTTTMAEQGVLSPDGNCYTFSAEANGYARGEAINAVYLKPLDAALRDGNPVRAVIRGTSSNSDGCSPGGVSAPNSEAQAAMIRRAYEVAGIKDYSHTAFVECHGTGTAIGDPRETDAVASIWGPAGGVHIGSVKPNMGHSEGASGLTSLIKAVMALENKTLPPNIKFKTPNPDIKFDVLTVPTEPTAWPASRAERVSVNSFGIGGSNAHVILDSASSFGIKQRSSTRKESPQLLLFSGASPDSVKQLAANYNEYLDRSPEKVADLAYTLANHREHWNQRCFAVAKKFDALSPAAVVKSPSVVPQLVMVFTGQGAQWPLMGRELMQDPGYSVFKDSIKLLDKHLQTTSFRPDWSIEEELLHPPQTSRLNTAELSQPLCTAIQVALVDLLATFNIKPAAVVGHSSGELAAAYAAGAITAREAIIAAYHRGAVSKLQSKAGAMAAIGMGREEIKKYLTVPGVVIACENSPKSVTISGDASAVKEVVANIKKADDDVLARLLKVDKAYHSHHMVEIGEAYYGLIEKEVHSKQPTIPFFSSVTGELVDSAESLGARYWQKNLESPVLFETAVTNLLQHEATGKDPMLLEVGPHAALSGPLRQIQTLVSKPSPYTSVLMRNEDCVETFLTAIGRLYCSKIDINFKALMSEGTTLSDLPRYPWNHSESYWEESRLSREWRLRQFPHHDLLGVRLPESTELNPTWRNVFHLDHAEWIRDHKVMDDVVFPMAGYIGMVGEAVRQISGLDESYNLRHVTVSTALVLNDAKPTEIITSFRKHRLTDMLDSQWWEFTIASHNGQMWMKHCAGEVRAGTTPAESGEARSLPPRKVTQQRCYDTFRRAGLRFGPAFRTLQDVRSETTTEGATARAVSDLPDAINYHMHPTLIDAGLQLLAIAASRGFSGSGNIRMLVPTLAEEITIFRTAGNIDVTSSATFNSTGTCRGQSVATADGITVMKINGLRLTPVDDGVGHENRNLTARVEWGPHIDFQEVASLFVPNHNRPNEVPSLDKLSRLCMTISLRKIQGLETQQPHMQKYVSWIKGQLAASDLVTRDIFRPIEKKQEEIVLSRLSDDEIMFHIATIMSELHDSPALPFAEAIKTVCDSFAPIYTGEKEALEVLMADELLTRVYRYVDEVDRSAFFKRMAFTNPHLRVLEIGAGTGGTTSAIFEYLSAADGRYMFSEYCYTDISAGMFVEPKERFKSIPNIEYTVLDIYKDISEQGFENRQFDLIVASNVLHATRSLQRSLQNVRKLLAPEGRFFLTELAAQTKSLNYIWGTLPGWWAGDEDGRVDEPYVDAERWRKEFNDAGFDGLEAVAMDGEAPYQLNAMMVGKPKADSKPLKKLTLLCQDVSGPNVAYNELIEEGYSVDMRTIYDLPLPANQDVIATLDLQEPFFTGLKEERLLAFKKFINSLEGAGIMWLTKQCQMGCTDPRYAQSIGVARTMRSEALLDVAVCEVDDDASSIRRIVDVFSKFQLRKETEISKPDMEYAISKGIVNVSRIFPFRLQDALAAAEGEDDISVFTTRKPGRLDDLRWYKEPRPVLKGDAIEVVPHASGLNFKDILVAMGIVDASKEGFGLEAAGTVSRVGPDAKDIKAGDRVMFMGYSAFASHSYIPESLCAKMPDSLSFEDGATMPCVYSTSIWSLFHIGGLRKGQTVLIHSATGGVGISSIQLALMVGAEVFATVGNDEKVKYLMETFGLPRNRIFHSRDTSFVEDVMRETKGEGVDLALNSLSGELLHATWKCIAKFGKLVEIGKRDLLGAAKLDMTPFLDNRSYCCVDLDQLLFSKPAMVKGLLYEAIEYYQAGHIKPIRPITVMPATKLLDAFRTMQQGQHMGKIVIRMRQGESGELDLDSETRIQKRQKSAKFDGEGYYLLVGGLGGLGRSISTWMIQNGARHFIYLSRSAANSEHEDFVHEIESMGCDAKMVPGSVSNAADVSRAVEQANGRLKGVLQLSMVLRDQAFQEMTIDEWNAASVPKVEGTWNLHQATLQEKLDFFLLFSSLTGQIGTPGQANYASGNTFLDAFAQYRSYLGLPASVIDIGAVQEIGYLARNEKISQRLEATGMLGNVSRTVLLNCVDAATTHFSNASNEPTNGGATFASRRGFTLGLESDIPLNSPENRIIWKKDMRMAIYHNETGDGGDGSGSSNDALKAWLAHARHDVDLLKSAETPVFLATEIGKKIFSLLLRPDDEVDISASLVSLGMDSLVALEMRSWWKQVFAFDVSVLEMMNLGALDALGKHAAEVLIKQAEGDGEEEQNGSR